MKSWLFLLAAILLEVFGTTCMKLSQGFTRLTPSVGLVLFYAGSFVMLTLALRTIPVSVAYAIWSGVGTAVIAVIGVIAFKEPLSAGKVLCLGLIIAGVVGLHLTGSEGPGAAEGPTAGSAASGAVAVEP